MREVDVDRMMARISARQYKEWEAYERATGPLDGSYEREMAAQGLELIQINNQLTGAQITKKGQKNPAGKFQKIIRPDQIWLDEEYSEEYDQAEEFDDDDLEDYYPWDDDEEDEPVSEPDAYDPAKDPFAHWDK